jgi:transcriptional regulator with XRE-family HTH domain
VVTPRRSTGGSTARAAAQAPSTAGSKANRKLPATSSANGKAKAPARPPATKASKSRARPEEATPPVEADDTGSGRVGWVIANHVRRRRQDIGLTVGQLAERSGISKGMLSKIENAQTSPSLATLERLASALDMPLTSLFRGLAEERDAVFVKADSGPEIVRQGTRAGHAYQLLGSLRGPRKQVEPLLVTLTERAEIFPSFQHSGTELLYMLSGTMDYSYGKQQYRMEPGDTLQFEGDIPHGPTLLVTLPIRFLSITFYDGGP